MKALLVLIGALQASVPSAVLRAQRGLHLENGALERREGEPGRRIAWFHAPKTATSFGATVLHYANPSLPENEPGTHLSHWNSFFEKYQQGLRETFWIPSYDHARVPKDAYEAFRGNWVGLFRQPEQRLLSLFMDKGITRGDVRIYAERNAGAVVKELSGQEDGEAFACWPGYANVTAGDITPRCGGPAGRQAPVGTVPAVPDVATALRRLEEGFMFVGIVEQYNLSICLFHAMFGGDCLPAEFGRMRNHNTSWKVNSTAYNVSRLQGYEDPYDGELYRRAEGIFRRLLEKHSVTAERCRSICPNITGAF